MFEPIPAMKVRVGNRGNTSSYEGVWVTEVIVKKVCPVCGGPRGDSYPGVIREDGESYRVDNWKNDCGHHDWFLDFLVEAGIYPSKNPDRPRLALFKVSGDNAEESLLHAYWVPQDKWHRGLTEAEAEKYGAPEVWALPS